MLMLLLQTKTADHQASHGPFGRSFLLWYRGSQTHVRTRRAANSRQYILYPLQHQEPVIGQPYLTPDGVQTPYIITNITGIDAESDDPPTAAFPIRVGAEKYSIAIDTSGCA